MKKLTSTLVLTYMSMKMTDTKPPEGKAAESELCIGDSF